MRVIIDGDGCPGIKFIEKACKEEAVELIVFSTIDHNISLSYGEKKVVDAGFQSVDMYVMNEAKKDDIIVTQDYGVAAMVLGKKSYALNTKGQSYDNDNIERLLFERHLSQKARRAGARSKGPSKRKAEDNLKLYEAVKRTIKKAKEKTQM
ncbi:MAG: YaiI/YqxD family protein [Sarcina sp.]